MEQSLDGLWRRVMARLSARARPERERVLVPARQDCPGCGGHMRLRYENRRTLVTLSGPVRLRLRIRRCKAPGCPRFHVPYRPEAEGALALPQHEFGLDVIHLVGVLRHREHRSVPEIHAVLRERGVMIAERSVTNLLDRYDELLAIALIGTRRLRRVLKRQGGVILALDGLQPDVGHEVLWVVRDCLSGEVLLARSLLSGRGVDLEPLLREVAEAVGVPVLGVVSDGQTSIRRAVERALPGVPHQLCQFHFLREAAHPVFEADRHAKVARGYCAAVRSAITDDGRTPLAASGLKLKDRLTAVADSLDRVAEKGAGRRRSSGCTN
jgi:Transposase, Mutator family